jgi:hypothetical protein
MNFRFAFTADKTTLDDLLAIAAKSYAQPLPQPVVDLIHFALRALPDGWEADVECTASLSLDLASPMPSSITTKVVPRKKA